MLLTAGFYSACTQQLPPDTRSRISLEGNWGLQLDTAGTGIAPDWLTKSCTDSLFLPGITDMGKMGTYNTDMTLTTGLSREYVFEGKALYTKQIRIPEEWDGTSVRLVMERTKPTTIWIDGKEVGANNDISTAQQYDLSSYLFPGTHTVAILVDNGKQAVPEKVYGSSHAYSASTQTNWNGIIGDFFHKIHSFSSRYLITSQSCRISAFYIRSRNKSTIKRISYVLFGIQSETVLLSTGSFWGFLPVLIPVVFSIHMRFLVCTFSSRIRDFGADSPALGAGKLCPCPTKVFCRTRTQLALFV